MKKKVILLSILSFNLLYGSSVEIVKTNESNTYNQVDDNYNDKQGFAFYHDQKKQTVLKKKPESKVCDCNKILEKLSSIEEENKKQTNIQQEILELIKQELHPKPEIITVDGKECIKNSSAECYKMVIGGKMKEIPAFVKWMENPSMQNTVNYLQWQSKHFKEIFKRGDSFPLAVTQFGETAYPLPSKHIGHTNLTGFNIKKKMVKDLITSLKDDFKYLVFFGLNKDLDMVSTITLVKLIRKYQDLDFTIVFKDTSSKNLFDDTINSIYAKSIKDIIYAEKYVVDSEAFNKYNIYTSPSIVAIDIKEKKAQTLCTGKIQIGYFEQFIQTYLEYNDKLDYSKLRTYKNWDQDVNYRESYFKNTLGIKINKIVEMESK